MLRLQIFFLVILPMANNFCYSTLYFRLYPKKTARRCVMKRNKYINVRSVEKKMISSIGATEEITKINVK